MTQLAVLAAVTVETAAAMLSNSVVQVDYTLRKSPAYRSREVSVRCWCPACNAVHKRTLADSERGIPATMPGFVLSEKEVLAPDPGVRADNLGGIALRIGGERVPAREVARIRRPRAVVLEAERPIPGARPLEFGVGAVSNWFYIVEHEGLRQAGIKKNSKDEGRRFFPDSGLTMRRTPPCCIGLASDGMPVTVSLMRDFDAAAEVTNSPCMWRREGADVFEREASAREDAMRAATLSVVINLDPPKRESEGMRYRFVRIDDDDDSKKKEFDAVGYVMEGGLVLVPSSLTGEQIARISKIEAKMPGGKSVRLKFEGAYAEWNALALRFDGDAPAGLGRLSVAPGVPERPFDATAWQVVVENENGRIRVDARRGLLNGVHVVRDGALMPSFAADCAIRDHGDKAMEVLMTEDGRVLGMRLARRYSQSRWHSDVERVPCSLLARMLSERPYNPEFAPRIEDERNRLVWLGVETVELTAALAREKKAQSEMDDYNRPPLVTEVYPGSPADKAGILVDDILVAVRREGMADQPLRADRSRGNFDAKWFFEGSYGGEPPWPNVENSVNKLLTQHGVGARLKLVYLRGGERREADIVLEAAPVHYKNAKRARNRALGLSVADLTFEVRRFFKFADDAPGVVIAKVKPGSPAQVAGLRPCELVTDVNGEPVKGARDFAAKVKGVRDLTLSVRRLAETRVVRIRVNPEQRKDAPCSLETTSTGVRMLRGGKVLWNFEIDTPEGRPFFHPLSLPSGKPLTEARPKDHVWHLGYWFSWKYVNGVNYWEPGDKERRGVEPQGRTRVVKKSVSSDGPACVVTLELEYAPRETGKVALRESRTVTVDPPGQDGGYAITTRHEFTAVEDVSLDRTPPHGSVASGKWGGGYAGATLRIAAEQAAAFAVRGSAGGASSADVTGREAKSVDFTDPATGEGVTFTQLAAPASGKFYVWPDRRMVNPSPVYDGPLSLKAGERLSLAYKLEVHARAE